MVSSITNKTPHSVVDGVYLSNCYLFKTAAKLRLAMAAMGQPETNVGDLCNELGITRQTLYRHVFPKGELQADGLKLLSKN